MKGRGQGQRQKLNGQDGGGGGKYFRGTAAEMQIRAGGHCCTSCRDRPSAQSPTPPKPLMKARMDKLQHLQMGCVLGPINIPQWAPQHPGPNKLQLAAVIRTGRGSHSEAHDCPAVGSEPSSSHQERGDGGAPQIPSHLHGTFHPRRSNTQNL